MSTEARRVRIAHLYPEAMDLYGDIGNLLALRRRCDWRGIATDVVEVRVGGSASLDGVDLIVMGGGQDTAQSYVADDLLRRGPELRGLVEGGAAALAVCGGFQLFGTSYTTASGEELEGIGVFDARTVGGSRRLIGNITIEATLQRDGAAHPQPPLRLVGFENHAGLTRLGPGTRPLGRVVRGAGNLGDGSLEGALHRNAVGTYLHGPLLPKNPRLADHLIVCALAHRYGRVGPLSSLDDVLEMDAHRVAIDRCDDGLVAEALPRMAG
jgi:lipid II isoglutaminyl synthase (glutamine-hydrolysing)